MHRNGMNYALNFTNNHVISSIICMLSMIYEKKDFVTKMIFEQIKMKKSIKRIKGGRKGEILIVITSKSVNVSTYRG